MAMQAPVVIIGGGVAGLRCAQLLDQAGVDYLLLEKSDRVGGRICTDVVDGFRLDRGFQVFQTAYPEARDALDYSSLRLQSLVAGASIFIGDKWVRMIDPWRHPSYLFSTLLNPIGTPLDRWRLFRLRRRCATFDIDNDSEANDSSTRSLLLDECGFSSDFVQRFMRPWLSGIFLEDQLETSARFFKFVFRMLSSGDVSYPAAGMQAIPEQMCSRLHQDSVQLNVAIERIDGNRIVTANGQTIEASMIVVATDMASAAKLLPEISTESRGFTATRCTYFAADVSPCNEATLMLNGTGEGPINHVFIMNKASQELAPPGKVLISASSVGEKAVANDSSEQVLSQMHSWFGNQVRQWRELATYTLRTALPAQPPGFAQARRRITHPHVVLCGDYCETASLNGALKSGRLAAEALLAKANLPPRRVP